MNDKIFTAAVSTIATTITAMQGQTILDTNTLLPAGLWVGGLYVVWRASWRVCSAILTFLARVEQLETRLKLVEAKCAKIHGE